ncbi:MAG: thioredoxin family protein [Planctomycetes bacterium]|nr:thioredoxin family protein [Planctomycetota bacterium]
MNPNPITLLAFLAMPMLAAQDAAEPQKPVWQADFDVAAAAAKKAGKDLFVDFTGSDWCIWCKRLDAEVFEHDEFLDYAGKHLVLVSLDFPRSKEAKAKVPNPERNQELQQQYGVGGFPTVLLMTPDGEVFGRTGYQEGGPAKYVESLETMRTEGKKTLQEVKDLVAKFESAEGPARAAALELAIERLATMQSDTIGVDVLATVVEHGAESADVALQERSIKALLASGQASPSEQEKAMALDPKNEKGLYELVVDSKMHSVTDDASAKAFLASLDDLVEFGAKDEKRFEAMLMNASRWSFGPLGNKEGAKKYAELLKEHAADPEKYAQLFEQILGKG